MNHGDAFDVAIVGGGVAGSALAITLARAGMDVALIEKEARFRDRVRGDSLFPWGVVEATRLGLADLLPVSGARPLPIWQRYEDRASLPPYDWRWDVPTGDVVWGVDHPGLQESLIEHARDAGATVIRPAKALRPERLSSGLLELQAHAGDSVTSCCARLVVGADGKNSGARRWIGAAAIVDPVHHVLAGCLVEGIDLDPDAAHVGLYEGGMALLFHHASGRARAYVVGQPEIAERIRGLSARETFLEICSGAFPEGAFSRTKAVGPAAVFPASDIYADRIAGEGIVLIGDAAAANDPAQGQGLSLALRDVRELSELLVAVDDWQEAITTFSRRRPAWYEPLRAYALWRGPLVSDVGIDADLARSRAAQAAELDPFRDGYGALHALGPDGLPVTEPARRHFLGEDLDMAAMTGPSIPRPEAANH